MQLSNLSGNNIGGKAVTSESFLDVDILKNRILELEKQLSEKSAIIDSLTKQLVANSQDISAVTILSKEIALIKIKIITPYMKKKASKIYQKVVIIGDSMLNNINSRGLSKSKELDVLNFPGATISDVSTKIDDVLNKKPTSLITHVGTNDLKNHVNLLSN